MLPIGTLVDGKYKILREVGKGGMSVVYQAVNEKANKIWAIKEVRKDGTQNFEVVKQNLVAETDMLKRFNHPNLPSIIDVIDTDDSFLIVMDYIEGNSLSKAIETSGAQSQEDVIEWSKQLCDVLGYLHAQNPPIIYRDMKPANVMLKPDGNVSLIDFGTAREFKSNSVEDTTCLGTQGYAAPEQYGGQGQTDARTDIYCLGATMYHLITGHNPSTPPYEMYPIRYWNPLLSSGLEEIITKCTQRNPNDRYQSCAELLYALDHFQDLDIENKKVQNLKWKTFLASSIAFVVMLLATIGFKIGSNAATSQTYSSLIDSAQATASGISAAPAEYIESEARWDIREDGVQTYASAVDEYKKAIAVNPTKVEAYQAILDLYMRDGFLTRNEYEDFTGILSKVSKVTDSSGRNINAVQSLISGGKENYALLEKDLADDLFFCYGGADDSTGIEMARNRYSIALENTSDEALKEEIDTYITISKVFSANRGKNRKGGDAADVDFKQAFSDMENIVDTIDQKNNVVYSLRCYRMVIRLLYNHSDKFLGSVTEEEYNRLVNTLSTKLQAVAKDPSYNDSKDILEPSYKEASSVLSQVKVKGLTGKEVK